MKMMSSTRRENVDQSSGSTSDSERSVEEETRAALLQSMDNTNSLEGLLDYTPISPLQNYYRPTTRGYSYPVIDMRKTHRLGSQQFHKLQVKSGQPNELKVEVSKLFGAKTSEIHIIEEKGRKEEVLLKTVVVILPETVREKCYNIIIELFGSTEDVHPHILCARLPVHWKILDAKKLVMEDTGWKGLVLCRNHAVIEDDMLLKFCNFENLEKIQAVKQTTSKIEFIYQPRSDVLSTYYMDVDMNCSVKQVKKQFEAHFHEEIQKIQKQEINKEIKIHFCFQSRLLDDRSCIGQILRRNIKDDKISIHFGPKDSIIIDLKFRVGRKTRHKLLIVAKDISTMFLREEVSKHLGVDPKAVKLTFEEKLIDEHDNLSQVYKEKWRCGCRVAAGVKKCKTLRIRHPTENEEIPFEMYMLEPVWVLKQKIAEKWNLDLLQILLFCRGIPMENKKPLQYYPIKNNMEICLRLFENRIIIKVIVLKEKRRIKMIVDNCCTSTVDDLLRFCAHHFGYARQCSRGIFKDKCLERGCTLEEEGIQSGDTVIIAYFDQPFLLQGSLINIFMASEEGHMVKRIGAVSSGLLLHAPKTAEAPQSGETCLDNGPVPEGLSICDSEDVCSSGADCRLKSNSESISTGSLKPAAWKEILIRKKEFLKKSKQIIQKRLSPHQTMGKLKLLEDQPEEKPSFYLYDTDTDSENITEDLKLAELSLDETGKKTVVSMKDNITEGQSNRVVKSATECLSPENQRLEIPEDAGCSRAECKDCVRRELESDCPASGESMIYSRVKCIENCCQKIQAARSKNKHENTTSNLQAPVFQNEADGSKMEIEPLIFQNGCEFYNESIASSQDIRRHQKGHNEINHNSVQQIKQLPKKTSFHTNNLSGCETETSGCESGHMYKPNIPAQRKRKEIETDSSDIEQITSCHGEDCQCSKCWSRGQFRRCPYLQKFYGHRYGYRMPRTHTLSEGATNVTDLQHFQGTIHFNRTFSTFEDLRLTKPNGDIETSGITAPLLYFVGKSIGKKWKHLLRKLEMDERDISAIEYQFKDESLHEIGIQALLLWKRDKGIEGAFDVLQKALEDIGLKSVAEHCQNTGYCTA